MHARMCVCGVRLFKPFLFYSAVSPPTPRRASRFTLGATDYKAFHPSPEGLLIFGMKSNPKRRGKKKKKKPTSNGDRRENRSAWKRVGGAHLKTLFFSVCLYGVSVCLLLLVPHTRTHTRGLSKTITDMPSLRNTSTAVVFPARVLRTIALV